MKLENELFPHYKYFNWHLTQRSNDTILLQSTDFTRSSTHASLALSPIHSSLFCPRPCGPRPGAVVSTTLKGEVVTDSSIYLPRGGGVRGATFHRTVRDPGQEGRNQEKIRVEAAASVQQGSGAARGRRASARLRYQPRRPPSPPEPPRDGTGGRGRGRRTAAFSAAAGNNSGGAWAARIGGGARSRTVKPQLPCPRLPAPRSPHPWSSRLLTLSPAAPGAAPRGLPRRTVGENDGFAAP